jgi:hypothetical protein
LNEVKATLKQLVRDETLAKTEKREQCFAIIMDQLEKLLPEDVDQAITKVLF